MSLVVEVLQDTEDLAWSPCTEFFQVLDAASLQGVGVRPSQLRSKLLKKQHFSKKGFFALGGLFSKPFKVFVRCVHSPHTESMNYNSYSVKFILSRSSALTLPLTLRRVHLRE